MTQCIRAKQKGCSLAGRSWVSTLLLPSRVVLWRGSPHIQVHGRTQFFPTLLLELHAEQVAPHLSEGTTEVQVCGERLGAELGIHCA